MGTTTTEKFRSLKDLWNETWPSQSAAVAELKANAFAASTKDYEVTQMSDGTWHLSKPSMLKPIKDGPKPGKETKGLRKPVKPTPATSTTSSAEERLMSKLPGEALPGVNSVNGKKAPPLARIKAAAKEMPAPAKKEAAKKAAAPPPAPPKKEAPKKAAASTNGIKNGPIVERLPDGFDKWAVAEAKKPDGVTRPALVAKTGQGSARWKAYLEGLAKPLGLKVEMDKLAKVNRFRMVKG